MENEKLPQFDRDLLWCDCCKNYQYFEEYHQGPFVAACPECNQMYRAAYFSIIEKEHPAISSA